MNALTYDECKSDMNTNTALIILTTGSPSSISENR